MKTSLPVVLQPISITDPGHYILEGDLVFQDLLPARQGGTEEARIRLNVGLESTLDLPLSPDALTSLFDTLSKVMARRARFQSHTNRVQPRS